MAFYSSLPGQTAEFVVEDDRIPQRINSNQRVVENLPRQVRPVVRDYHPGFANPVYQPTFYQPPQQPVVQVAPVAPVAAAESSSSKCSTTKAVIVTVLVLLALVAAGVGLGLYFTNKNQNANTSPDAVPCKDWGETYGTAKVGRAGFSTFADISSLFGLSSVEDLVNIPASVPLAADDFTVSDFVSEVLVTGLESSDFSSDQLTSLVDTFVQPDTTVDVTPEVVADEVGSFLQGLVVDVAITDLLYHGEDLASVNEKLQSSISSIGAPGTATGILEKLKELGEVLINLGTAIESLRGENSALSTLVHLKTIANTLEELQTLVTSFQQPDALTGAGGEADTISDLTDQLSAIAGFADPVGTLVASLDIPASLVTPPTDDPVSLNTATGTLLDLQNAFLSNAGGGSSYTDLFSLQNSLIGNPAGQNSLAHFYNLQTMAPGSQSDLTSTLLNLQQSLTQQNNLNHQLNALDQNGVSDVPGLVALLGLSPDGQTYADAISLICSSQWAGVVFGGPGGQESSQNPWDQSRWDHGCGEDDSIDIPLCY